MQAEQWCLWPKFPSFLLILTENWWSNIYNLASVLPRMNWRPLSSVIISDALTLPPGTWDQVKLCDCQHIPLSTNVWLWYNQTGTSKNNEVTKFEDDSDDDDWSEKPAKTNDNHRKPAEKVEETRKKESTFLGGVFSKNKEVAPSKLPTRKIVGERLVIVISLASE